ncbi:MAG: hypothetical protein AAGE52_37715 [Myxococcota bacterium]
MRILLVALLTGCELVALMAPANSRETELEPAPAERLVDQTWNVGRMRVVEEVEACFASTLHHRECPRTYTVWREGRWADPVRLSSEDRATIEDSTPPIVVEDHLAIFLRSEVLIFTPEQRVVHLARRSGLDLPAESNATAFRVAGSTWEVDFSTRRERITVTSDNAGQSWSRTP